ncbi:MAG: gamma-glutamyl-phosphate reductase, partial [Propionibacterium sp.]
EQLWLSPARFAGMVQRLRKIASLPDPVGEVVRSWQLPNGKQISQVRVPFGLAAVIYDAPDITARFSGICLKSGNAALLRGSRLALNTNRAVVSALRAGLTSAEVAEDAIALVSGGKEITTELMHSRGLIDVLVPCGDANLVEAVLEESQIPVLNSDDYDINQFSIDIGAGVATEVSKKIQSRVSVELAEMTSTEYIVLAK